MKLKNFTHIKELNFLKTSNCYTDFNGVDECLLMDALAWLYGREWNQAVSVSVWFKKVDGGLILPLGRWMPNPNTQGWFCMVINPGKMRYQLRTAPVGVGKWMDLTTTAIFSTINDVWNHALYTDDGSGTEAGVEMYLNSVASAHPHSFGAGKDTITSGTIKVGTFEVGCVSNQPYWTTGGMKHLAYWDRVLTPAEVVTVFQQGNISPNYSTISGLQSHNPLTRVDFLDRIDGLSLAPVNIDSSNIICQ